ncbi:Phosphopantetheine adenylyltransferase 1 [Scenedesmus sp. PABB004]|nr:Phosphopantetheine adenylyltransferase 1 [Scenedesmus sp. PABB004]
MRASSPAAPARARRAAPCAVARRRSAGAPPRRAAAAGAAAAAPMPDGAALVLVPPGAARRELEALLAAGAGPALRRRVYLHLAAAPPRGAGGADRRLLEWLAELYAAVGALDPRLDVVPCLACAGWDAERLAALPDLQALLAHPAAAEQARALAAQRNARAAPGAALQAEVVALPPEPAAQEVEQPEQAEQAPQAQPPPQPQSQQPRSTPQQQALPQAAPPPQEERELLFDRVAVGGTFDRLHAGHRLLLAATALVCRGQVFVGITSDALLAAKANRALLHGYDARRGAAVDFLALVRPGLAVSWGALADPQAPTQAELDPGMQALVVSQETLPGGEAINAGRARRGFAPLALVAVGLVGGAAKLSSTALREADAAAAAMAAAGGRSAGGVRDG